MTYHMYITDALVCGSRDNNTSDRSYLLFSRDAGMVWVSAKSVREERSKHRYALQDFSVIRASLIRGKSGWKVTGAEPIANLYYMSDSREARTLVRNITRLLRRLLQGDTPVPSLYDDVSSALTSPVDPQVLETVISLRILHTLGYIAPHEEYQGIIDAADVADASALLTESALRASQKAIRHALESSHL